MAAWGAVTTLTGFRYSGVDQRMTLAPAKKEARVFWSNGYAWGTCLQRPARGKVEVEISVAQGKLKLKTLALEGFGETALPRAQTITAGRTQAFTVAKT
jgi:hypothetical protein